MGILRANTISGLGTDGPVFQGVTKFDTQGYFTPPVGVTSDRTLAGITTTQGAIRFNTDSQKMEFYAQDQWWEMVIDTPNLGVGANTTAGARGLNGAGYDTVRTNVIDYINISSTGNALDFGDLFTGSYGHAVSSSTRGIWGGGNTDTPAGVFSTNRIEYVTISSTGNGTDFGDLLVATSQMSQSCSNATRGLFAGGGGQNARVNTIQYITMSSTGNSVDFGDLTRLMGWGGSASSPIRGIFAGGAPTDNSSTSNIVDFVTISTLGNATDFGDLTSTKSGTYGCSNTTRGLFGGGNTPTMVNTIDYITISTLGNAVTFGQLTEPKFLGSSCSSPTRGVFFGGNTPTIYNINIIEYITIAIQGNAVDFGDLTRANWINASVSNAHGGL